MVFFGYNSSRPLEGILSYIYYKKASSFFKIDAAIGGESYEPYILLERNKDECALWYGSNNWTIKLKRKVLLTNYEFENAGCSYINRTFPLDFNLYGSNDGNTWHLIDSRDNQSFCNNVYCDTNVIFEYSIRYPQPFCYFRIQNVRNSQEHYYLILRSFEMYGFLMNDLISCTTRGRSLYNNLLLHILITSY